MTKHVNMRPPELVNRPAKRGASGWASFLLILTCAGIGWSLAIAGFEPPPPVKTAVGQLTQQIADDISQARDTIYGTLSR